jgi:hypothetical protein
MYIKLMPSLAPHNLLYVKFKRYMHLGTRIAAPSVLCTDTDDVKFAMASLYISFFQVF